MRPFPPRFLAAALEDFDPHIERREPAWVHFGAAMQMIRDRGGPAALVQHNRLQPVDQLVEVHPQGLQFQGPILLFRA